MKLAKGSNSVRRFLFGFVVLVSLVGCVPSQNLRVEDRQALKRVYIVTQVTMPERPTIITRGMAFGAGLGGVVGGIVAAFGATPDEQLVGFLAKNDIHVDQIVDKAFSDRLAQAQKFEFVSVRDNADASIQLEVVMYGIGYTANMFSHDYRAMMAVRATMTRADGKVIWIKQAAFNAMSGGNRPAVPFDDLFTQPELMRKQMTLTAQDAAAELVTQLVGSAN